MDPKMDFLELFCYRVILSSEMSVILRFYTAKLHSQNISKNFLKHSKKMLFKILNCTSF